LGRRRKVGEGDRPSIPPSTEEAPVRRGIGYREQWQRMGEKVGLERIRNVHSLTITVWGVICLDPLFLLVQLLFFFMAITWETILFFFNGRNK
jgi:hypothetical protein